MIKEAYRKVVLLMESMQEGGAAGHMTHPFDADDFTFGDYKQLVIDLLRTGIERYSEKLDGMNIFATVDRTGTPRFARNKGHIKSPEGGMDPEGIKARWGAEGADPTILAAYTKAYRVFSDVVSKLKNPVAFFNGDGYKIYVNAEVIDQTHPNVIPYPEDVLSFHGLAAFADDGSGNGIDIPDEILDEKMKVLTNLMPDFHSENGKAQITPEVAIDIKGNNDELINKFISQIDAIEQKTGVNDNTTIIQYREKLLPEWMRKHGYGIILDSPYADYFLNRWVYGKKDPSMSTLKSQMRKNGVENWQEVAAMASEFDGQEKAGAPVKVAMSEIMRPVEMFFYRLGDEMISRCRGYANTGREDYALGVMTDLLNATKKLVTDSDCLEAQREITPALQKLAELDFGYHAMEGVVFNYKGHTFKLTGSFAALNRAINSRFKLPKDK